MQASSALISHCFIYNILIQYMRCFSINGIVEEIQIQSRMIVDHF